MNSTNENSVVTIITVVYNGIEFIEETIESVIGQKYKNIEYIIVDGGSTDGTLEIIKKYEDKISLWISEPDKGIYDAMNKGIDLAKGEWCNFLNAGDSLIDDYVLENIFTSETDDATLIYGDIVVIKENGELLPHKSIVLKEDKSIRTGMKVCHQAIFYHKDIIEKYDSSLKLKAEWKHLIHMTRKSNFVPKKFDFPFVYYRAGGIGAKQVKINQKEYRKVFFDEYGKEEYIKYIPFFTYMIARRTLKSLLQR